MKALFICKGNMFRSQMAAAIYNKLTSSNDAFSAGTHVGSPEEPEGQILEDLLKQNLLSEEFFELMKANGMDVRKNKTVKLLPKMIDDFDVVVSMAEEPYVPEYLKNSKKVIKWGVKNPVYCTREVVENTHNQLNVLVSDLIKKN